MEVLLTSFATLATEETLRILLDGRILAQSSTGIARYTLGLMQAWCRQFPDDEWLLVTHQDFDPETFGLPPFQRLIVSFPGQTLVRPIWERFMLRRAVAGLSEPPMAFFSPLGTCLPDVGFPSIATVHDLAFLRFSEVQPLHYRVYWKWVVARAVKHARGIVAVSESTRRDLIELLGADPGKVQLIYEGVDEAIRARPSEGEFRQVSERYGLPDRFLLFVGTIEPRKNVAFLLDVWERLGAGAPPLVLAGGWGWLSGPVRDRIAQMSRAPLVLGHVPPRDLAVLYRKATLFVFASRYEGFGLPLAEAMASGLPVVATRTSSVPEVIGDAGLLIEPGDCDAFVTAVDTLLEDTEKRRELAWKGRERAQRFSWDSAAAETRNFIRFLSITP
jgi:glycosyltransferase involved in cell wall biosynthesis